jgi:hypothetical protein
MKSLFLPINIIYKTNLTTDSIQSRLKEFVGPGPYLGMMLADQVKPYFGVVRNLNFRISRFTGYESSDFYKNAYNSKNHFPPDITGTIIPGATQTKIQIKIRLNSFVLVFLGLWFGGVGFACIATTFAAAIHLVRTHQFEPALLILYGMLLIVYAIVRANNNYEIEIVKSDLEKIFEAEAVEEL